MRRARSQSGSTAGLRAVAGVLVLVAVAMALLALSRLPAAGKPVTATVPMPPAIGSCGIVADDETWTPARCGGEGVSRVTDSHTLAIGEDPEPSCLIGAVSMDPGSGSPGAGAAGGTVTESGWWSVIVGSARGPSPDEIPGWSWRLCALRSVMATPGGN